MSPTPRSAPPKIEDQAKMNIMKAFSWVPHFAKSIVLPKVSGAKKIPIIAGVTNNQAIEKTKA